MFTNVNIAHIYEVLLNLEAEQEGREERYTVTDVTEQVMAEQLAAKQAASREKATASA